MKIEKVDLATFRFRGGLRAAFLGSSEFSWSVHRPSSEKPGVWREVDKATVLKDGGLPLFMGAVIQPWTNLRMKLDVGVISSSDLAKEGDPSHPRFPMVVVYTGFVSFAHRDAAKGTGLPTMPYLIDNREVAEEEMEELPLPTSIELKEAVFNMFTGVEAPHTKSNMDKLREVLQGDWKKGKPSKYTFPGLAAEGDDDERESLPAGQATWPKTWTWTWTCSQFILILTGGMEDAELTTPVSDEEEDEEDEDDGLPKVANLLASSSQF